MVSIGERKLENMDDSDWLLTQPSFFADVYLLVNGNHCEIRRKILHTKDLPVNIPEWLMEGENKYNSHIIVSWEARDYVAFVFAIERVETESRALIIDQALARTIPSDESLTAITKGLQGKSNDDEEEVDFKIVEPESKTNISLIDPVSQLVIGKLPARSKNCKH